MYFQGCSLHCPGCWNPATHKFRGVEIAATVDMVERINEARRLECLDGVTFSGGEPMQQAEALLELMAEIRKVAPSTSLGMFTGYTEDELRTGRYLTRMKASVHRKRTLWQGILGHLDFAVMGRYDATQPAAEPLKTSQNQRLMLFTGRYTERDFGPQLVEITIAGDGASVLTGFPVLGVPV
ncbi:MAG: radical SAM protein [Bryobacteraceae bacterium]|nr:radical SAM protein [Bryobacteraceae bacterium]